VTTPRVVRETTYLYGDRIVAALVAMIVVASVLIAGLS
jgi:hypothetical protein